MTITIEKNIPMPVARTAHKYPFESMAVGDSFMLTAERSRFERARSSVYNSFINFRHARKGSHATWRIAIRRIDGGLRCWRVA